MKQFTHTVASIKNASGEFEPIPALRGATSYEIAVRNGFKGTEDEWYNMAFDEGWVTKYQELEANKANKSEVYEKGTLDFTLADQNFKNLVVETISSSETWTAPKAANQLFRVFCVGGGGGGGTPGTNTGSGGGGGGYIEISDLTIPMGTEVDIVCGAGGTISADGSATSFGEYLTAEGGKKGEDGTETKSGNGGNGGSGGGGGGTVNTTSYTPGNGGTGDKFGGGGGGGVHCFKDNSSFYVETIGNGGASIGCGAGGTYNVIPMNGKRFDGFWLDCLLTGVDNFLKLDGKSGSHKAPTTSNPGGYGGSGGNGGNGGGSTNNGGSGGGGGYCGNGAPSNLYAGGGGGGYFGNGGVDVLSTSDTIKKVSGGGGGGFFCDGGHGGSGSQCGGGGGGFFDAGIEGGLNTTSGNGGNGGVLIMYIKED